MSSNDVASDALNLEPWRSGLASRPILLHDAFHAQDILGCIDSGFPAAKLRAFDDDDDDEDDDDDDDDARTTRK
jgi:hypothetical protein